MSFSTPTSEHVILGFGELWESRVRECKVFIVRSLVLTDLEKGLVEGSSHRATMYLGADKLQEGCSLR